MFYKYFKIQTKNHGLRSFTPKPAQKDVYSKLTNKNIILKARQLGFSTLFKLMDLNDILEFDDKRCFTAADTADHAEDIYNTVRIAWDNLPESVQKIYRPKYSSRRQLYLQESRGEIVIGTSGRSGTAQRAHISEFAFMTDKQIQEVITGTFNSVPKEGQIIIESTANGFNWYKEMWDEAVAGKNGYTPHFYNWTWDADYQMQPPKDKSWKKEYIEIARAYELFEDIQERFNLSDPQFYWYYIKALEQKEKMKQEYPTTPEEAFLTTGKNVFDLLTVNKIQIESPKGRFMQEVRLWEKPKYGSKYIIGIDTAEGVDGDRSALFLLNADTNEQAGEMISSSIEPHNLGELAVKLATMYNKSYIVCERNGPGLVTATKIRELGGRQYINRSVEKIAKKSKNELGWRTTTANRDVMIDEFREALHNGDIGIKSKQMVTELMTFVWKDNGKREHQDGEYDDLLFAAFLAWQGKKYHRSDISDIFI